MKVIKYRGYTQKQINFIFSNLKILTCKEMSKVLGKSPEAIRGTIKRAGVRKTDRKRYPKVQKGMKFNDWKF